MPMRKRSPSLSRSQVRWRVPSPPGEALALTSMATIRPSRASRMKSISRPSRSQGDGVFERGTQPLVVVQRAELTAIAALVQAQERRLAGLPGAVDDDDAEGRSEVP